MPRKKPMTPLVVAICTDSDDDKTMLKSYVIDRGWQLTEHNYRTEQWRDVLEGALGRRFNAVCGTTGGVRWLAQVAPEADFQRQSPKPTRDPAIEVTNQPENPIIERARALISEGPQFAETIAHSLIADHIVEGTVASVTKRVRQSLIASKEFCAQRFADGEPLKWVPWKNERKVDLQSDGTRIIHTEVLSTTGIPVHIAIPVKSDEEIAKMLLDEVLRERAANSGYKKRNND